MSKWHRIPQGVTSEITTTSVAVENHTLNRQKEVQSAGLKKTNKMQNINTYRKVYSG